MKQLATIVSFCCMAMIAVVSNGCSSSTDTADSMSTFSMTIVGAPSGSRNFATYTVATVLTPDSILAVVGSNTPIGSSITKNNYAALECRGVSLGRRAVDVDATYSPANMMVTVNGRSYYAISGSVTITEVGPVGRNITGTFEGVFIGDNDARIDVTNGSFSIKRSVDNAPLE